MLLTLTYATPTIMGCSLSKECADKQINNNEKNIDDVRLLFNSGIIMINFTAFVCLKDTLLITDNNMDGLIISVPLHEIQSTNCYLTNYDVKQICNKYVEGTCKGKSGNDETTCEMVHVNKKWIEEKRNEIVEKNNGYVRIRNGKTVRVTFQREIKKLLNVEYLDFLLNSVAVTKGLKRHEQYGHNTGQNYFLCIKYLGKVCQEDTECDGIHVIKLDKFISVKDRYKNCDCGKCKNCKKIKNSMPKHNVVEIITRYAAFINNSVVQTSWLGFVNTFPQTLPPSKYLMQMPLQNNKIENDTLSDLNHLTKHEDAYVEKTFTPNNKTEESVLCDLDNLTNDVINAIGL